MAKENNAKKKKANGKEKINTDTILITKTEIEYSFMWCIFEFLYGSGKESIFFFL